MNSKNKLCIDLIKLWEGCILVSIASAIMVSKYPMLSFENSWDNFNYNLQDVSGNRGTITFYNKYCVGAFRNENSKHMKDAINNKTYLKKYFYNCEYDIFKIAKNETLQYLMYETNYGIYPCITSTFWGSFCDNKVYSNDTLDIILCNGADLIKYQLLDYNNAMDMIIYNYDMNSNQILILEKIFKTKIYLKDKPIFLSKDDIKLMNISTYEGFKESKISFSEIGIYFDV